MNVQALAIGPSMKALAVVLKALLQQAGLNERVAGGLGSYCLLNLVMAHLLSQVTWHAARICLMCVGVPAVSFHVKQYTVCCRICLMCV